MSDDFGRYLKLAKTGDQRALAKLLTLAEERGPEVLKHKEVLKPKKCAFRIGVTGPPGAGKSTLVGQLLAQTKSRGSRIAVLAVDPSSPFSRGAILGDRLRYSEHALDPKIFVRSIGTRGSLGGLTSAAYLMLRIFDAVGIDLVLIETVGVGQTELEIMNVADCLVVVLVPESGDSIQAMKAGLLEIADIFVVNKSDRPGAAAMMKELEFISETAPAGRRRAQVLATVATEGSGVLELISAVDQFAVQSDWKKRRQGSERLKNEALALLRGQSELKLSKKVARIQNETDFLTALALAKSKKS